MSNDPYTPIPTGFDFPADAAALTKFRDNNDVHAMRTHVWSVWAGINQPTSDGGPLWETWFPSDAVFSPSINALSGRKLKHPFQVPRQFRGHGPVAESLGQSVLSFVLFNKDTRDHIRSLNLYKRSELQKLNDSFPATAPIDTRRIPDFPNASVSLKVVWKPVHKDKLTVLPIWDDKPTKPDNQGNPESTWARVIAVDPTRQAVPAGETTDVVVNGKKLTAHVVSISDFYHVTVETDEEVAAVRQISSDPSFQTGDFAVLEGMHLTTKEIPDWVWATFWWHDKPDDGPWAADRPDNVKGVFRHYLMNTAYSADTPVESDGTPRVCFNPWLEARFRGGLHSNCMACHQRAVFSVDDFLPVTRGAMKPDDTYFKDRLKLDFLWSVLFEAQ